MIVFGVPYSTTKDGFREYFAQFGELMECELMFNREGRSRGFGFVLYKDDALNKQCLVARPPRSHAFALRCGSDT
eukprot:1698006-Rhodomonas_salina.2